MSSQSLLVQGAGSWGTALAMVLSRNCYQIYLWDTNLDTVSYTHLTLPTTPYV